MKAVALISQNKNHFSVTWQFDKVMSAIAYDVELSVVFIGTGCSQILETEMWNCLCLYGVENIYMVDGCNSTQLIDNIKNITQQQLKTIISDSDIVL